MKKNLLLAGVSCLAVAGILLIGNLIIIGEKVRHLFVYADYVFYICVAVLLFLFLVRPFLRVVFAPEIPALDDSDLSKCSDKELFDFGMMLAKNNGYITKPELRKVHRLRQQDFFQRSYGKKDATIQAISEEIGKRLDLLGQIIRDDALTTFTLTALSQNGKLDFISLLAVNFRMVGRLVRGAGFRPSYRQQAKVYYNVLASAILTNVSEEMLDDIDLSGVVGKIKIPDMILTSLLDGTFSALLTLRIGYITSMYIVKGAQAFDRKAARRYALKQARREIGSIFHQGRRTVCKSLGKFFYTDEMPRTNTTE